MKAVRGRAVRRILVVSLVGIGLAMPLGSVVARSYGTPGATALTTTDFEATVPPGTDSVAAGTSLSMRRDYSFGILASDMQLTNGAISVTPTSGSGPESGTAATIDPGDELPRVDVDGTTITASPTFDSSRSVSPGTAPSGDSTQTVTVSVTPQTTPPSDVTQLCELDVFGSSGGFIASDAVVDSAPTGAWVSNYGDWVAIGGYCETVGDTLTAQVTFDVSNPGLAATFDPNAVLSVYTEPNSTDVPQDFGQSSIATSYDEGTAAWSIDQDADWTITNTSWHTVDYLPTLTASPPVVDAVVIRDETAVVNANTSSTTQAVSGSSALPAFMGWEAYLDNFSGQDVTAPEIDLNATTLTFSPPVSLPASASASDLPSGGNGLNLNVLAPWNASTPTTVTPGYDLTQTVSSPTIAPGGGTEDVTITLTAHDPALVGSYISVSAETDDDIGGTSIEAASIGHTGDVDYEQLENYPPYPPNRVDWEIYAASVETPYTFHYTVDVPNTGAVPITYRPTVFSSVYASTFTLAPDGTSTTITDPVLGGAYTFSVGQPVEWSTGLEEHRSVNIAGTAVSTSPVDHFHVAVSPTSVSAGSPATVTITPYNSANHVVTSYRGPVSLVDSSGTAAFGPVTWSSGGIGTTTVTVPAATLSDRVTVGDQSTGPQTATGTSGAFQVIGALDHFKVAVAPATGPVTTPVTVTITPQDSANHTLAGFSDAATTVTDSQGAAGASFGAITWAATGVGTETATFSSPVKSDTIVVSDGAISKASGAFSRYGAPALLKTSLSPSNVPVGGAATLKVTAYDSAANLVAGYAGPASVTDDDGVLAPPGAWSTPSTGVVSASVSFSAAAKGDKIEVADGSLTSTSNAFNVIGPAVSLKASVTPTSVLVSGSATVKTTAYDSAGNVATGYTGTPALSDSAGVAVFSLAAAVNGVSTATMTFSGPAKGDKVTPSDGGLSVTLSGAFNVIGAVASFKVTVSPATVSHLGQLTVTTTALDTAGNTVTSYAGPVTYSDTLGRVVSGTFDQVWTNGLGVAHITFTGTNAQNGDKIVVAGGSATGTSGSFKIT
jgi:hypothetical protein